MTEKLQPFGESIRFETSFSAFAAQHTHVDFIACLLEHHRTVQNNKPPNGRAPWLDWLSDDKVMVRAGYVRSQGGKPQRRYLHAYRTAPLYSFARDLGMLQS